MVSMRLDPLAGALNDDRQLLVVMMEAGEIDGQINRIGRLKISDDVARLHIKIDNPSTVAYLLLDRKKTKGSSFLRPQLAHRLTWFDHARKWEEGRTQFHLPHKSIDLEIGAARGFFA
jgi:hypothetical protein